MPKEFHHIVPVCQGGSNSPDNIIALSPTAHAIISLYQSEHYGFCCMHRRQRKFLPPELLELADFWFLKQSEYATAKLQENLQNTAWKKDWSSKVSEALKKSNQNIDLYLKNVCHARKNQPAACKAALSEQSQQKRKETLAAIQHQQGRKNSQFGTMWITDGQSNKKIKKDDPIPTGYKKGRTL